MNEHWKEGYKRALIRAFVRTAAPVSDNPSFYGWTHRRWEEISSHLSQCGVDIGRTSMPEEVSWEEFQGTFVDNHAMFGLEGRITCNCGKYKGLKMRLEESFSALLHEVLRED